MNITNTIIGFIQAHKSTPSGIILYSFLKVARANAHLMGHTTIIEQALHEIGRSLILDNQLVLFNCYTNNLYSLFMDGKYANS